MPNLEHKEKINQFVNKAIQFNKHHNIFQRTSVEEVFTKDVEESLQINPHISKQDTWFGYITFQELGFHNYPCKLVRTEDGEPIAIPSNCS